MAIVAMVNDTKLLDSPSSQNYSADGNHTSHQHHVANVESYKTCPKPMTEQDGQAKEVQNIEGYGPKYNWNASEKSHILAAFFLTYVLFQIPAARFAEKIGAKWILATATVGSSVLSLVTPWAASLHAYTLVLVRALMGICQTALYPACYVLYSHWLPPLERSQALPVLCAGAYLGSIIASTSAGYFIQQPSLGWEFAFYMPCVVCAIWSMIWIFVGSSEPREHKTISLEEIEYIESKMEIKRHSLDTQAKKSISWKKLLTSQHIWAMIVAFFASNWSFSVILLQLPTYLNDVLHVGPLENGMINSVIYILYCISSPFVGSVSTMMVETRTFGLSRLNVRKIFQGTALFGQAICFIALPLIGCDTNVVMGILFVQIVLLSFVNGGEVQLPTELSVDFSGTIYAVGNCVGSSTGFIVPVVQSWIVDIPHNRDQWSAYFYVAASVSAIGGLIFLIFGKNDLQDYSRDLGESQIDICKPSKGSAYDLSSQHSVAVVRQEPIGCRGWKKRDIEMTAS